MDLVVGASSDATKSIVSKLGSLIAAEYTLIRGVRDDIQFINDELESMHAFLVLLKKAKSRNEQRLGWMKQVREVAYDIEDCIDNINHRLVREPRNGRLLYLRKKWYLLTTLYGRHCIATEIGNLKARAQLVSDRRTRYGVEMEKTEEDGESNSVSVVPADRPTAPPDVMGIKKSVGLAGAMKDHEEWFDDRKHDLGKRRYRAIVGFGGLGKTTLAMALYREFGNRYAFSAFVLASQKFYLSTVLKSLITQFHMQQTNGSESHIGGIEEWNIEDLRKRLKEQLKQQKRYLIVVDDIWSVSAWERIKDYLPPGGTIVVTTRFNSVAEACRRESGSVYKHQQLTVDGSNELFCETLCSTGCIPTITSDEASAAALEKCCGGLPLAIVLVAGHVGTKLKSDSGEELAGYLNEVSKDLNATMRSNLTTEGVRKIIELCYDNLSVDLKTCLLYMSIFPKGCSISRKRLIRRWIAEGFIIENHGKTIQEVAEGCFQELISRNFICASSCSSNGKVKNYQIHDMVLEYIVSKSSAENFITIVGGHWQTPFPSYKVRRLSVHKSEKEKETIERMKLSSVRSLTAFESFKELHSCLLKFKILQVLDLEGCKDFSPHHLQKICKMHQLKYLSLRRTDISDIPFEIGDVENLEVLDIRETQVKILPSSVVRLKRMAHLLCGNKRKRIALALTDQVIQMTALETLSGIEISGSSAAQMVFRYGTSKVARDNISEVLEHLQKLTNLNKLSIYIRGIFDKKLLLSAVEHLSSCSLKFRAIDDDFTGFLDETLNSTEAPPEQLHTLELSGMLSKVPEWIVHLHSLEKLTLSLTSLRTDTLWVLRKVPKLFSLTFSLDENRSNNRRALHIIDKNISDSQGEIFVKADGFENLQLLRFLAPVLPPFSFQKRAMPILKRLELKFRIANGVHGLENLECLQQVVLAVNREDSEAAEQITQLVDRIEGDRPGIVYNESLLHQ